MGCPDYNVPWVKIHSRNDQKELALVSKLPVITLKKAGWSQAKEETNTPDDIHKVYSHFKTESRGGSFGE